MSAGETPVVQSLEACPVCAHRGGLPVLEERDGIGVVRCSKCGLVHATGIFAAEFLSSDYYGVRAQRPNTPRRARAAAQRKRRFVQLYDRLSGGRISRPGEGARALDIGCDTGLLLDVLRDLGYRTEGIERSPAGQQALAAGHDVHALDIEATDLGLGRYELITLTHVLEHLREPVRGLVWIRRHLAAGGLAVIEVPNWGDLMRPLWGRRFRPLELGDHLSFFERATLMDAITRAGLVTEVLWSAPQVASGLAPSLLTFVDLAMSLRRKQKASSSVAGPRFHAPQAGGWWRRAAPLVVAALDELDGRTSEALESAFGADCAWGANLVAIVRAPDLPRS